MLKTKCIKADLSPDDGLRISVMSKHTLPDGKTPDPETTNDKFDNWRKDLAPPLKLVGSYYRKEIAWEEFEQSYRIFIQRKRDQLLSLIRRAKETTITLLCVEASPTRCHRRLIAEECLRLDQSLDVKIE